MPFDSIFFDLDGTLWDSRVGVCDSWNRVLSRNGVHRCFSVPFLSSFFGKPMTQIFAESFPGMPAEKVNQLRIECCAEENDCLLQGGTILFPGVREVLERLSRSYRLFIISNCQSGYIETFIEAHSMQPYFTDHISWGDTSLSKGENNLYMMRKHGLVHPVYVGDAAVDEQSAADAGIAFIFARYGFGTVSAYDGVIDSFCELEAVLPQAEQAFMVRSRRE